MQWVLPGGAKLTDINHKSSERKVVCRPRAAVLEQTAQTHRLVVTTGGGRVYARYREGRRLFGMPNYRQLKSDTHSCGFIAVLTVVHYFTTDVPPKDVLVAVRPAKESGCDQKRVIAALKQFGISAEYRDNLGPRRLRQLVEAGIPVLVTVYPEDWTSDHWTVVRSMSEDDRVSLTNFEGCGPQGMSWKDFTAVWYTRGEGLVCRRDGTAGR